MIETIKLENFKGFKEAELILGPMSIIIGVNASGKSNIRDAFRFLHGISRGYTLAEILGEKWEAGGYLQWSGIRGGTNEITFQGATSFSIEILFAYDDDGEKNKARYYIEVAINERDGSPKVAAEKLFLNGKPIFDSHPDIDPPKQELTDKINIQVYGLEKKNITCLTFSDERPVLRQFSRRLDELELEIDNTRLNRKEFIEKIDHINSTLDDRDSFMNMMNNQTCALLLIINLRTMQFFDLNPEAMRKPSTPGLNILGDRGENLSSVLQTICDDPQLKEALIQWIVELTPMDVIDFSFPKDSAGKILVNFIEKNGNNISAYSASDGTLRFLAIIAALLNPQEVELFFFEELENGIHPNRLYLLLQMIQQKVKDGKLQIIATTHSPQLLNLIEFSTLENTSVTYRLPDQPDAHITRILDIPNAKQIIEKQNLSRLHETGWLEDALLLTEN